MNTYYLILVLAIAAALIPLSSIGVKMAMYMWKHHVLHAGHITTICTNVIGTLTKKDLTVRSVQFEDFRGTVEHEKPQIHMENAKTREQKEITCTDLRQEPTMELIATISGICHYGKMHYIEEQTVRFLKRCGLAPDRLAKNYRKLQEIPTGAEKKITTIVGKHIQTEEIFALSKGNPKKILAACTRIQEKDKKITMTAEMRKKIRRRIDRLNKNGQKVIAFAYKGLPKKKLAHYSEEFTENDLVFLGLIGLLNPSNEEIKESVRMAHEAGIKTYILSGMSEKKVTTLGTQLGLINPAYYEVITGEELKDLHEKKLRTMLENKHKDFAFTELKTGDRDRVIRALRASGEKVALTDSHDEKSFEKIMKRIQEGRTFLLNYHHCKDHAIINKIAYSILVLGGILFQMPVLPIVLVILLTELCANIPLQLSLAADPPKIPVMKKSPAYFRPKETHLISARRLTLGIGVGIGLMLLYLWSLSRYGWTIGEQVRMEYIGMQKTFTMLTAGAIVMQILLAFTLCNAKGRSALFSNIYLVLVTSALLMLLYFFTLLPDSHNLFVQLRSIEWLLLVITALIPFGLEIARKELLTHSKSETAAAG